MGSLVGQTSALQSEVPSPSLSVSATPHQPYHPIQVFLAKAITVLIAFVALVLHHYIQYSEFIEKEAPLIYAGATSVEIRSVGTFKISAAEKNWEENDLYGAGQWCKLFVEPHIIDENRCALQLRRRVNELIGQKFQEISTWALVRLIVQSHIKLTDGPLFPVLLLGLFCFAIFVAKYAVKYTQAIKNNFQISGLDSAPQTSASTSSVEQGLCTWGLWLTVFSSAFQAFLLLKHSFQDQQSKLSTALLFPTVW
mmetsp:Transcript_43581/g.71214  ORF Transcript_43581/g.71214 Transcript_43581/m.71214 type:complete len:253 (-) Transcript_43581:1475-2233(-)